MKDIATEWTRRRAVLLPSGAIITALGENSWAFRQAAYRWLKERGRL